MLNLPVFATSLTKLMGLGTGANGNSFAKCSSSSFRGSSPPKDEEVNSETQRDISTVIDQIQLVSIIF